MDSKEGRRLDRCDVCQRKVYRDDLRIMTQQYARSKGSNYFTYSQYNTGLWTCSGTDRSTISMGVRADESRVKVSLSNTVTQTGVQTWSGTGTFRTVSGVDVSGWTHLTFSCAVGPYQADGYTTTVASPNLTAAIGMSNEAGDVLGLVKTYTGLLASRELWFTTPVASVTSYNASLNTSDLCFYVTVTPTSTEYWWVDEMCLEADVTEPSQKIRTTGAAVIRTVLTKYTGTGKVCPECRYELFKTDVGPPEIEPNLPVETDIESTIL